MFGSKARRIGELEAELSYQVQLKLESRDKLYLARAERENHRLDYMRVLTNLQQSNRELEELKKGGTCEQQLKQERNDLQYRVTVLEALLKGLKINVKLPHRK